MCTVSFIPVNGSAFFTSNRDEKDTRSRAMPPVTYPVPTGTLLFPRDTQAGGTWTALHENGNLVIFLNGAFRKHTPAPPYRMSRGLLLLTLAEAFMPAEEFRFIDLSGIEPFTAVIWQQGVLFECRWDGTEKYVQTPDPSVPRIWSSVTLYDDPVIRRREEWFSEWLQGCAEPAVGDILHFHQHAGDGDRHDDVLMERKGEVSTVSITCTEIGKERAIMRYLDMKDGSLHAAELPMRELNNAGR